MKKWLKYNLLLLLALLLGVSTFLSPVGSGISIRTGGGLSVTFDRNEARAAAAVTTLGAAATKAGTSPWTALTGLSVTSGNDIFVVSAGDVDSTAISAAAGVTESVDYGGTVYALTNDGTYVYAGGATTETVRKYQISDMSYIDASAGYSGTIRALTNDGTYVYAAGETTQTIRKYYISNMNLADESPSYSGDINALTNDGTYVYAGGATTQTIRKYNISDMTYTGTESPSYGGTIQALTNDGTYVYAGGLTTQKVRKYYITNMTLAAESPGYGGNIFALTNDGTSVFAGGATTDLVRKYYVSNMTLADEAPDYGYTISALTNDGTYVYAAGAVTQTICKYQISDMSLVYESTDHGSTINALTDDGTYVFAGESLSDSVRKHYPVVVLTKIIVATNPGQVMTSLWRGTLDFTSSTAIIKITNTSTAKAMTAVEVSGLEAGGYDKSVMQGGSGTTANSGTTSTLSQADEVVFGAIGVEDEIDDLDGTWTTGAGYVSGNEQQTGTNGGGDSSNIDIYSAVEIVSATTAQTAQITGIDNADWSALAITYEVASGVTPSISNTPASVGFGLVSEDTGYWSDGSAPEWPLDDAECYYTITNSSGAAVDITIYATNFAGGDGWTLTSGSPGSGTVRLRAGKSGDANEAAMVILTTSPQSFITSLADSATMKWELKMETGTFTDGILKETTITLTAALS